MKDSDQKDDYYSVSKQPPMPMGAPPPPAPMGMPMGMPPIGGPMPPGAPMAPQGEELQEGEYMDPVTGKVMRRGEEFNVDPDRELDDPKRIAKWFDELKKGAPVPEWARPKSTAGKPIDSSERRELEERNEATDSVIPPQVIPREYTQQNFANQVAANIGEGPNYPLAEGVEVEGRGKQTFGGFRQLGQEKGMDMGKPTTRPTEPGTEQAQYDLDMEQMLQRFRNTPEVATQKVGNISRLTDLEEEVRGQDASSLADDFSRAGFSDAQDNPVYQGLKEQGYTDEELQEYNARTKEMGHRGFDEGDTLQPSWNKELAGDQAYFWDEDEIEESRDDQQLEMARVRRDAINDVIARKKEQEEERPFEDPFLQQEYKSWFREVLRP